MAKRPKKQAPPPPPQFPKVFETYRIPASYDLNQPDPTAFNGMIRIERYRVTVEKIDETKEVLLARLVKLWRESERNNHTWEPMRTAAVEICGLTMAEARELLKIETQGADYRGRR